MSEHIVLPERDREHERVLGILFNISPAKASVLSCLTRGTIATGDELLAYTGTKSHIKVAVSRTRSKLKDHGFDIHSKPEVGYWIEAAHRQKIEEMVVNFLGGK